MHGQAKVPHSDKYGFFGRLIFTVAGGVVDLKFSREYWLKSALATYVAERRVSLSSVLSIKNYPIEIDLDIPLV